jgi:hypothetical protein
MALIIPRVECGCTQHPIYGIDYCPLHKAAPEMLGILKSYHVALCEGEGCPACTVIRAAEGKGGE